MYKETYSQLETFSQPYFNRTFSNCFSHNSSAKGRPCRFRSRGTTGWTMILTICVLADVSKYLDILTLEFSIILEHLPFLLGYKPILRLLLVHRNPAIWRWYPLFLQPPFVMLMILVQWILHKSLNHLLQSHLGAQLDLYTFETLVPTARSVNPKYHVSCACNTGQEQHKDDRLNTWMVCTLQPRLQYSTIILNWAMLLLFHRTRSLLNLVRCSTFSEITKQWLKWSPKARVQQWDACPEPTVLLLTGCLTEFILTLTFKSGTEQ